MKKKVMAIILAATMAITAGSVYTVMADETAAAAATAEAAAETTTAAAGETAAAGTEVLTLNWDEVKDQLTAMVPGTDVQFGVAGMKAFVPSQMQAEELTDRYVDTGYVGLYKSADGKAELSFIYNETQYNTPESFMEFLKGMGAVNVGPAKINGLDAVHYQIEAEDAGKVIIFTGDNHVFEVGTTSFSDPTVSGIAGIVFSSLQKA